ncbi:tRNA adenosine(34) deaminase TadA [Rubeoparvulum massiliense]|uniref:tRNA adenosine(34) deaminase TadA n=1 Tax=Rubeoparvulum massiliense TaxID=1631346 RepID=UPI0021C36D7F|nr:tRNA adenosine(34) deaminase TadA [Rubeoparvulum massiliense]
MEVYRIIPYTDEQWMRLAIQEAMKAEELGEVPIGAILVKDQQVIGRGYNRREIDKDALAHAEIMAISDASRTLGGWRLPDTTLYVTLEPCPMCAGAILQARIPRVVYGTGDPKAGCAGTLYNLLQDERFNHQVQVTSNVLQQECTQLLKNFFRKLRASKR